MWLYFSNSSEVERIPEGRREKAQCGACGKWAMFYEANVVNNVKLYVVIPLWNDKKRVMQCGECLAACPINDFATATTQGKPMTEDFATGFQKMTDAVGNAAKGFMGKLDQMTFKMLVDNLKSNDVQVVLDTIEQMEKEKKPMGVAPLFFVSKNHPNRLVRNRADQAVGKIVDPGQVARMTADKPIAEAIKILVEEFGYYKGK